MNRLFFLFVSILLFAGCVCEEPPFLLEPTIPKVDFPPLNGETEAFFLTETLISIPIQFSEPMDTNSVFTDGNLILEEPNSSTLNYVINWLNTREAQIILFVQFQDHPCVNGCNLLLKITDQVGTNEEVRSVDDVILDGDCDGEPGGIYLTNLFVNN